MTKLELKSLEDASILRKFSVLFTFSSVLPLIILTCIYFAVPIRQVLKINSDLYFWGIFAVTIFVLIGFVYMRQTLARINKVSTKFRDVLKDAVPKAVDIQLTGDNEVTGIAKSFNELVNRLETNIVELEKYRHMLMQALDREQMLSRTDYLTGIANRRVFYELAEMEINKFRRYRHPFTALLIDIDNFKHINDSYGHQTGDVVLCAVANAIKGNIRVTDIAARMGGDEFTVLLTETGVDSYEAMVPRLKNKLMEDMGKHAWPVTFSIGVVTYKNAPANVDEIIKKVDSLMYDVKRGGRNNIKCEVAGG